MRIWVIGALVVAVLGFAAYVRLAPGDPARWHVTSGVSGMGHAPRAGGHVWRGAGDRDALARLDAIIRATPRTQVMAGSVGEGRITYVTRSAVWGFPDYTTLSLEGGTLEIYGRLRFGKADLAVNRTRIEGWLALLGQG